MSRFFNCFLAIAFVFSCLEVSAAEASRFCEEENVIQSSHIDFSDSHDHAGSDCGDHKDCAQCHYGHCHHLIASVTTQVWPSISFEILFTYKMSLQDIYLIGFHRPPIA